MSNVRNVRNSRRCSGCTPAASSLAIEVGASRPKHIKYNNDPMQPCWCALVNLRMIPCVKSGNYITHTVKKSVGHYIYTLYRRQLFLTAQKS